MRAKRRAAHADPAPNDLATTTEAVDTNLSDRGSGVTTDWNALAKIEAANSRRRLIFSRPRIACMDGLCAACDCGYGHDLEMRGARRSDYNLSA